MGIPSHRNNLCKGSGQGRGKHMHEIEKQKHCSQRAKTKQSGKKGQFPPVNSVPGRLGLSPRQWGYARGWEKTQRWCLGGLS